MNTPDDRRATVTPLSLRKNFSWTFAGRVVYAASQWGILVVLAKLGNPEMVGQFALGIAVTAPFVMFANLNLRAVQATDTRREYQFADYLGLRMITTVLAYPIIVGIVLVSGYGRDTALVILFIGLSKSFEAISDIFFGLLQQRERMDRIAKSLMIEGPITLAVMGIILYFTRSVVWATAGMAVVWGLQLLLYDMRSGFLILHASSLGVTTWQLLRPRFRAVTLSRLVWLTLPLGFVTLFDSLNTNIPRYYIEQNLGKDQLGIFAPMAYLMVVGTTVISSLGQSAHPKLAMYYAQGNQSNFQKLLMRLLAIGLAVGITGVVLVVIAGREILDIFYGAEYAAHSDVFVLIMIAAGINYLNSFLRCAMIAARYFRAQLPQFFIVAVITTAASYLLIPVHGLRGAAVVLMLAAVVQITISGGITLHAAKKLAMQEKQQVSNTNLT